ncbi:MAG TPA: hypothetical protein VGT04_12440 [Acidobacteriaceae bacterium]|nr:hypothetical protein [Acidobacteriaceae bacterium]
MRVLFAVFVVCLVALILTLMALRRHVRKHNADSSEPPPQEDSLKQNE